MQDDLFGDKENQILELRPIPRGVFSTAFEVCRDLDNQEVYFKDGTVSRLITPKFSEVNFIKYAHNKFDDFASRPEENVHNVEELSNIIIEVFVKDRDYAKELMKAVEEGRHMSLEQKSMINKASNYIWTLQNDYVNGYEENSSIKVFKANEKYRNTQTIDFLENFEEYLKKSAQAVISSQSSKRKYIKNYKLNQKLYFGQKFNLAEKFDEKFLPTLKKTK